MHLLKKWSKYAFAYASMQMHNYPKPTYDYFRHFWEFDQKKMKEVVNYIKNG